MIINIVNWRGTVIKENLHSIEILDYTDFFLFAHPFSFLKKLRI